MAPPCRISDSVIYILDREPVWKIDIINDIDLSQLYNEIFGGRGRNRAKGAACALRQLWTYVAARA